MKFAKNKKEETENRKLRFIDAELRATIRDILKIDLKSPNAQKNMNVIIEYRAKEIYDWT